MPAVTDIQNLLLRFKSSGDHGQAEFAKILSEFFDNKTLFMSGDLLAYVYSIASNISTVARFYNKTKRGSSDEADDDGQKNPHFIVAYFPEKESDEKFKLRLIRSYENFMLATKDCAIINTATPTATADQFVTFMGTITAMMAKANIIIDQLLKLSDKDTAEIARLVQEFKDELVTFDVFPLNIFKNNDDASNQLVSAITGSKKAPAFDDGNYAPIRNYIKQMDDFIGQSYFILKYEAILNLELDLLKLIVVPKGKAKGERTPRVNEFIKFTPVKKDILNCAFTIGTELTGVTSISDRGAQFTRLIDKNEELVENPLDIQAIITDYRAKNSTKALAKEVAKSIAVLTRQQNELIDEFKSAKKGNDVSEFIYQKESYFKKYKKNT